MGGGRCASAGGGGVVAAGGVARLPRLLPVMAPVVARGAVALLHKGADFAAEVAEARTEFGFDLVEHPSVSDPAGRILEVRGIVPLSAERMGP